MTVQSILFVDDDQLVLDGLKRMLRPLQADCQFSFAGSASEALILLETVSYDIVATDMCMPQMNGMTLLELIKNKFPDVIRIMMTGQSDYEIYRNGMDVSQYFLWKPVSLSAMETLLQLLSNREICL